MSRGEPATRSARPVARIAIAFPRARSRSDVRGRLERSHALEAPKQLLFCHHVDLRIRPEIVTAKHRCAAIRRQQRRSDGFRLIDFGIFLDRGDQRLRACRPAKAYAPRFRAVRSQGFCRRRRATVMALPLAIARARWAARSTSSKRFGILSTQSSTVTRAMGLTFPWVLIFGYLEYGRSQPFGTAFPAPR